VLSLSLFPPPDGPEALFFPTASISSINIIEGAFYLAYLNKLLTL